MARIAPPHVTLVYPEETNDEESLVRAARFAASRHGPFVLRLEEFIAERDGDGGVFVRVGDPSGRLTALRDELLLPPQRFLGYPFHSTVVHPRTSDQGPLCWSTLAGQSLGLDVTVHEMVLSSTTEVSRTVLERFPLLGPAIRQGP
jgi:hypothetical protein